MTNTMVSIPAHHDKPPASSEVVDKPPTVNANAVLKMRKRTKTGCLTCRKRRIKCGEERPTCANCVKSKRTCEGYNQRVVFKPPLGDWTNQSGAVSKLPYHSRMLPGYPLPVMKRDIDVVDTGFNRYSSFSLSRDRSDSTRGANSSDAEVSKRPVIQKPYPNGTYGGHQDQSQSYQQILSNSFFQGHIGQSATQALVRTPLSLNDTTRPQGTFFDAGYFPSAQPQSEITSDATPKVAGSITRTRDDIGTHTMIVERDLTPTSNEESMEQMTSPSHESSLFSGPESEVEDSQALPSSRSRRDEVIDRVMAYFLSLLNAKLTVLGSRSEESSFSSGERTHSSGSNINASSSKDADKTSYSKRPCTNNDDNLSDNEEAPPKRSRFDSFPFTGEVSKLKFACPYFKRNQDRYVMRRSCVGPGWEEVRRVKEHLYRNHRLPVFCPRCYETFTVDALLHVHQRADEPCEKRPEEAIEGFDSIQERNLKSRKKPKSELTEENKWREMYRILFPNDDDSLMPSPYMDSNWEQVYQKGKISGSNEVTRYEQFLRRELPTAVRRQLEVAVDEEFTPIEERLKSRLIDIVRDVQLQLFETYTRSRNDGAGSSTSKAARNSGPALTHIQRSELVRPKPQFLDELAPFEPIPPLDNTNIADFDAILFQFDDLADFNDSTYGSLFDSACAEQKWDPAPEYPVYSDNDNGKGSSRSDS